MLRIPGLCLVVFVFIALDVSEACGGKVLFRPREEKYNFAANYERVKWVLWTENGYEIKVTSVKTCENSAIKFNPPITVTADKNCNLFFNGCATLPKQVTFAKATYSIRKPPLPDMEGEVDVCNVFTQQTLPQVAAFLGVFNLPTKCPIPAKNYCADPKKAINIAQFKNAIALVTGKINGKLKVKHDGGQSCAEFVFTITRAKSG